MPKLATVPVTDEVVAYIARFGGKCRDCADNNGTCPSTGLSCASYNKAIRHVLGAYNYGVEHGFLKPKIAERGGIR